MNKAQIRELVGKSEIVVFCHEKKYFRRKNYDIFDCPIVFKGEIKRLHLWAKQEGLVFCKKNGGTIGGLGGYYFKPKSKMRYVTCQQFYVS